MIIIFATPVNKILFLINIWFVLAIDARKLWAHRLTHILDVRANNKEREREREWGEGVERDRHIKTR